MTESCQSGYLEVILGPMFAGKTTEMLRRVRRHKIAQKKCLVVKYDQDTRYSDTSVSTHDNHTVIAEPVSKLMELGKLVDEFDVIGIDEGQFYPDLLQEVRRFLRKGKIVIVAALDGTFEQKPFGDVLHLIPMADYAIKLTAVCALCFNEAPFTQRLTTETKVEVIGGSEMYRPVCRTCFIECTKAMAVGKSVTGLRRMSSCDYGYGTIPDGKSPSTTTATRGSKKRGRNSDHWSPTSISFDLNGA